MDLQIAKFGFPATVNSRPRPCYISYHYKVIINKLYFFFTACEVKAKVETNAESQ